jgi:hypothetical protein
MAVRVCPERLNGVPMVDDLLTICCSIDHISAADGTMPLAPFSALGVVSELLFFWDGRELTCILFHKVQAQETQLCQC